MWTVNQSAEPSVIPPSLDGAKPEGGATARMPRSGRMPGLEGDEASAKGEERSPEVASGGSPTTVKAGLGRARREGEKDGAAKCKFCDSILVHGHDIHAESYCVNDECFSNGHPEKGAKCTGCGEPFIHHKDEKVWRVWDSGHPFHPHCLRQALSRHREPSLENLCAKYDATGFVRNEDMSCANCDHRHYCNRSPLAPPQATAPSAAPPVTLVGKEDSK